MTRGAWRLAVGAIVVGLAIGGCASDDDSDSGDGGDDDAAAATIEASATEYEFAPEAWTVTAGEEFTIDFTNDGTTDHEWAVLKLGEDIEEESEFAEDKVLLEVEAIDAGTSTTEAYTIDEAGVYQVICAIEGHFDEGMEGVLSVE